MVQLPPTSRHLDPEDTHTLSILSEADATTYLERINLPASYLATPPSLESLQRILTEHINAVPYDSSALHVSAAAWRTTGPLPFGAGDGMDLGQGNFDRIVRRRQGGMCFAINCLFAALLRSFGFRVSELGGQVYLHRGQDPAVAGYYWTQLNHEVLVVDWPGPTGEFDPAERYIVDAGFGGGSATYPIRFADGATASSVIPFEAFYLKREHFPVDANCEQHVDNPLGYTLYRRICAPADAGARDTTSAESIERTMPGYWTPCYHFFPRSLTPLDIYTHSIYNEHYPLAPFQKFFSVSVFAPDGTRKTLLGGKRSPEELAGEDPPMLRFYTKKGAVALEKDTKRVPYTIEAVREVLEQEFGYIFD